MNIINIEGLVIKSMPAEEYHAHQAVGHSSLVKLMRSPAHYRAYMDTPREPTPAMFFGTALHTAVLEPERFRDTYVVKPSFDRRTKAGKEGALEWEENHKGFVGIEQEQMDAIRAIQVSVFQHRTANQLLSNGHAELSVFWIDPDTGIECKCRPDFLTIDENGEVTGIVDVKSAADGSSELFAKAMVNYGYDLQSAFYSDPFQAALGREIPFRFIAAESDEPFAASVYRVGERTLQLGRKKYKQALQLLAWCRESNSWPSYQPFGDEEAIEVPHWAFKGLSDQD